MPFKSEKQRKWMHANKPKMAKKWEKEESVDEFRIPSGEQKLVYQFKGFTASQMDELQAMLHRAGIVTTPDFNKRTITTHANRDAMKITKNKTIQRFIKSKGGKQIKESTGGLKEWTVKQQKKYKVGTKMKPVKMGTQRVTKDKKYRILTIRQWLKFPNYARLVINGIHHIDTKVDGKIKQLPVVFVDKQDKVVKLEHVEEGFGGQLKGADKKKFEKFRKDNAEVLGYTLTGTSDVKVVNESHHWSIEPSGIMAKINKIVQDKQAAKIDGVLMDMFSASIMMRIYDAVNDKAKKDMNKGTMRQVKVILHKVMKQNKVRA